MTSRSKRKRTLEFIYFPIVLGVLLLARFLNPDEEAFRVALLVFAVFVIVVYPLYEWARRRLEATWQHYALLWLCGITLTAVLVCVDPYLQTVPFMLKLLIIACVATLLTLTVHWISKLSGKSIVPSD